MFQKRPHAGARSPIHAGVAGSIPLLMLLCGLSSCRSEVAFYEREALGDTVMALDEDSAEAHFHQKIFYSMEGSAGGIGGSGGGGCGCY